MPVMHTANPKNVFKKSLNILSKSNLASPLATAAPCGSKDPDLRGWFQSFLCRRIINCIIQREATNYVIYNTAAQEPLEPGPGWRGGERGSRFGRMSQLCSATFEQLFSVRATSSNFFLFEQFFEQLLTRVQTLQYEMFTCGRQLFLLPTSKDPGYEIASFSNFCDIFLIK